MMTTTERVAYLKGLAEGLGLDSATKEGKVLLAIIDVLDDIAFELADVQDSVAELEEQVDMIDEDLDTLEEEFYDMDDDCDCDCDCGCGCDDEDEDDDDSLEELDGDVYEVICPTCGDSTYLDDDLVAEGEITCPGCGEVLEFVVEDEEVDS